MKYKEAKKIVEDYFLTENMNIKFGCKFRIYPRLRKQMKRWALGVLEET